MYKSYFYFLKLHKMAWPNLENTASKTDEPIVGLEWDQRTEWVQNIVNWQLGQNFEKRVRKEELDWDIDAVLEDLKENCVKIEENVEMMWYDWDIVHIEIPPYKNFEWLNFDYFVSYENVDFILVYGGKTPEYEENLYSVKDVSKLLQAINSYMTERHVTNDWAMDYEKELWGNNLTCKAWDYLKAITWLDDEYWLSEDNLLHCCDSLCGFINEEDYKYIIRKARLFWKLLAKK